MKVCNINLSKLRLVLPALLLKSVLGFSQFFPADNDELNYTQVLFQYPEVKSAAYYVISLSELVPAGKSMAIVDSSTACVISNLKFGVEYKWYVDVFGADNSKINHSKENRFRIKALSKYDTTGFRLELKKHNHEKVVSGLIWIDNQRVAVDRNGKVVWFLPQLAAPAKQTDVVRDLKMSPAGSITYLADTAAIEIDLKGNLLWKAPNDGKITGESMDFYHHDFRRMANGNYMVLGSVHNRYNAPTANDTNIYTVEHGSILEYAPSGKLLWFWRSDEYFSFEDVFKPIGTSGNYDLSLHMNAVFPDSLNRFVYAGFRNVHRIIKIDKSTKKVVASYGMKISDNGADYGNGFFRFQHDATLLRNGNIAVYNNDDVNQKDNFSSVIVFSQEEEDSPAKIQFKFDMNFDKLSSGKSTKMGNVTEMPNGNLLVCAGTLNRIIEINYEKEVLWDAFIYQYDENKKKWFPGQQYRTSFSTSLYPHFLTLTKVQLSAQTLSIYITNEGSDADLLEITYIKKNVPVGKLQVKLAANQGRKFQLKMNPEVSAIKVKSLLSGQTFRIDR